MGRREIAWINEYAVPRASDDPLLTSMAQNSPETHIALLEKFIGVAPYLLALDHRLLSPNIWHTDLHSSNLFIDHGRISSVIDWQGVWAGPLLLQAQPPELVAYQGDMIFKRPKNFEDLDDVSKSEVKQQIFKSTLLQLYLIETKEKNPRLAEAFDLDHGKTRRFPFLFAGNTWDDDIVAFRESLINVERYLLLILHADQSLTVLVQILEGTEH